MEEEGRGRKIFDSVFFLQCQGCILLQACELHQRMLNHGNMEGKCKVRL